MLALLSAITVLAGPHAEHTLSHPGADLAVPAAYRATPTAGPDVMVYGYLPYWADDLDLAWDQLSHVAIFDVELQSDGSLSNTSRWTGIAQEAMNRASPFGVKIHLTVTCFSDSIMGSVLPSPSRRAKAIAELAALVDSVGAHGVSVDFEGMESSLKADLVSFVAELDAVVDEVTIATPAVDWNGAYDYDELAAHGWLFIMGYGYHWSGGDPGPVAPLHESTTWGKYGLDWSVQDHMTWGAPADRIILGMPLYGRDWPSVNTDIPGDATGDGSAVVYADAVDAGDSYGRKWNADGDTAYTFPDSQSQLWYDDLESIRIKTAYAVDAGIAGVGFWALNYEGGDAAFWQMMDEETRWSDGDADTDTDVDTDTDADADADADTDTDTDSDTDADTDADLPQDSGDDTGGWERVALGSGCSSAPAPIGATWLLALVGLIWRRSRFTG